MAKKIKLSVESSKLLGALASDLQAEWDDLREVYDGRTETWRDGDLGVATDGWLEELEALIEALENFPDEPEA